MEPIAESAPGMIATLRRLAEEAKRRRAEPGYEEREEAFSRTVARATGRRWCDACRGTGRLGDGRCAACRPSIEEQLERAGVPELLRGVRFEGVEPELRGTAASFVAYLDGGFGESVFFSGPVGRGKTYLAACACRWAAGLGWSVAWAHVPSLLRELRASYDRIRRASGEVESEDEILGRLRRARLLVLNDLGAEESPSPWAIHQLETLIDERLEAGRRMIVTSNLDTDEIRRIYGDRTASRLGVRGFRTVEIDGKRVPDFRERRPR